MVENLQIIMINKTTPQPSLFSSLTDQLNPRHPLYLLANKIDWRRFEEAFSPLYCAVNGRPAKPTRLMCGLLLLNHVRTLSDESVIEQWSENADYQYFCGMLGSVVILGGLSLVNSLHAYTFASLQRKKRISTTPLNDALNALILALNASAAAFVLLFTKKFKILS